MLQADESNPACNNLNQVTMLRGVGRKNAYKLLKREERLINCNFKRQVCSALGPSISMCKTDYCNF